MSSPPMPIARVTLARSLTRLLVVPVAAALAGIAAVVGGLLLAGAAGIALGIAGVCASVSGIALGVILFSLRLEVEVAAIRVRWWGGERRYPLARGSVTRIAARGPNAPRVRVRFGALGWGFGPGVLRDAERIEVVRLAPHAPLILLPTVRGRLAVAPAVEQDLLAALTAAARVQQRLDAAGSLTRHAQRPAASSPQPTLQRASAEVPARPAPAPPPVIDLPRPLTGIERAQLEQRLAVERERRAAEAAARAEMERAAQREREEAAARAPAGRAAAAAVTTEVAPARRRQRARWRAPGWLRRSASVTPRAEEAASPAPQAVSRGAALRLPSLATAGLMLLPSLVAGGVWLAVDAWLAPPASELRQIVMALVLAGPAATVASIVTWFVAPRLSGLPLIAGMAALVLVGRALLP